LLFSRGSCPHLDFAQPKREEYLLRGSATSAPGRAAQSHGHLPHPSPPPRSLKEFSQPKPPFLFCNQMAPFHSAPSRPKARFSPAGWPSQKPTPPQHNQKKTPQLDTVVFGSTHNRGRASHPVPGHVPFPIYATETNNSS